MKWIIVTIYRLELKAKNSGRSLVFTKAAMLFGNAGVYLFDIIGAQRVLRLLFSSMNFGCFNYFINSKKCSC